MDNCPPWDEGYQRRQRFVCTILPTHGRHACSILVENQEWGVNGTVNYDWISSKNRPGIYCHVWRNFLTFYHNPLTDITELKLSGSWKIFEPDTVTKDVDWKAHELHSSQSVRKSTIRRTINKQESRKTTFIAIHYWFLVQILANVKIT